VRNLVLIDDWTGVVSNMLAVMLGGFLTLVGSMWTTRREVARNYRSQLFNEVLPPLLIELSHVPGLSNLDGKAYFELLGRLLRASKLAGRRDDKFGREIIEIHNRVSAMERQFSNEDSEGRYHWSGSEAHVRGHENVLAGGQVQVSAGGQVEVPAPRWSSRLGA
jgi:hypothetical protein